MLYLYPIVFISGILTVLSPCVLPILPIVLGSGLDGSKSRINGLIAGLVVSFTFFALILSTLVSSLGISADTLRIVAAIILGFFGLTLVVPQVWLHIQTWLEAVFHPPAGLQQTNQGFGGGFLTGVILGLVWTPCVGPIIATVTTFASLQAFSLGLVVLMLCYSIGIALPLFAIAHGGARVSEKLGWYRQHQGEVRQWFGVVILLTALLIGTGIERRFQAWVLEAVPASISNPVEQFENRFDLDSQLDSVGSAESSQVQSQKSQDPGEEVVNNVRLQLDSDGAKVPLSELLNGCPFKDCIPAINEPEYDSVEVAGTWLNDFDRVFVLEHNNQVKIFPQRIMNWHEIVNDWFGDDPIAVTFCPLCGTATAFERRVDGVATEFGVSGKLHNSDLVMYDRYEGSLWQQVTGEAIVGPAARRDEVLEPLFLVTLEWQQAQVEFPKAQVLSRVTGHSRDYSRYPYGSYEQDADIYFQVSNQDDRLHPKAWVLGITVAGSSKAYVEDQLAEGTITDTVGGTRIEILKENDIVRFTNLSTDEEIVPLRSFWFAWVAFNADTELYR